MKKTSKILLTVIVVVLLGIGVSTFFKVNGSIGNDKIQLRLAHGQAGDSEIGGNYEKKINSSPFDSSNGNFINSLWRVSH